MQYFYCFSYVMYNNIQYMVSISVLSEDPFLLRELIIKENAVEVVMGWESGEDDPKL